MKFQSIFAFALLRVMPTRMQHNNRDEMAT